MRKFDSMTELYNSACKELSAPEPWLAFLRSACRNYKLHFDEQLMVYAQRPDATAVLELDTWNKSFRRWVNRGSTGIAVFDRNFPGKQRLKYYFDVSDTHEGKDARPVPLWEMQPEYEEAVIETLESTFGELGSKDTLADAIFCAAENAAQDNYDDYLYDLMNSREGSMLDGLPDEYVEENFKQLLANSIAYMMMERCGVDSAYYLGEGDFIAIREFSSQNTLNAIGLASSDVGEMALREIASTVLNLARTNENPIRTFAPEPAPQYIESKTTTAPNTERNESYDQFELHDAERIQSAEPDSAAPAGGDAGQIRTDAEEIPRGASESILPEPLDQLHPERASLGDSGDSHPADGAADTADGEDRRRDREPESQRPDAVDGPDEQYPAQGGGDSAGGAGVQLETEADSDELPAFLDESLILGILKNPHDDLQVKKDEILSFFLSNQEQYKRAALMKDAYPQRYTGLIIDEQEVGYVAEPGGLIVWRGKYLTRTEESKLSWGVVAELTAQLIQDHEYIPSKDIGRLPKESSPQMSLFDADTLNYPTVSPENQLSFFKGFEISQQIIDEALCLGSNEPNSLERICAHFAKDYPLKENAIFLQQEYGEEGKGFYSGSHLVSVWFDDTGFRIAEGRTTQSLRSVLVPWEDAARRVRELLDMGRFAPQAVLDNAAQDEIEDVAANLWYVVQDFSQEAHSAGYLPTVEKIYMGRGGFPANTEEIATLLWQPETLEQLRSEMADFVEAYKKDPTLQRFRWSKADKALNQLEGLQRHQLQFKSQLGFSHEPQQFITTDEMDAILTRGGNVQDAKFRIYSYYLSDHTPKERADFLKHEYGTGGSGWSGHNENHDSKGIEYSRGDIFTPCDKVLLKWNQVEKRIGELIRLGRYMSKEELAKIPAYEKNQLARGVYNFFSNQPDSQERPYPVGLDYSDALPYITEKLDDPQELAALIQLMQPVMEATPLLDRYHSLRQHALENVIAFSEGRFSLFGGKHKAAVPTNVLPAEEKNRTTQDGVEPPAKEKIPEPESLSELYQLDYRYLNDRLVVFNRAGLTPDDLPVVVARVEPDGEVVFLDAALPESLKDEIRQAGENHLGKYKAEAEARAEEMILSALEVYAESTREENHKPDAEESISPVVIGKQFIYEGRQFEITSVNAVTLEVKLRDDTFMAEVGMPITRVETIPIVEGWFRKLENEAEKPLAPAFEKQAPTHANQLDAFPGVPMEKRHNYQITDDHLGEGGPKEKFKANIAAIRLLKELTQNGQLATPEQQEILAQYVGWGGLDQAFDETNASWAQEYQQLKALLPSDEYESARATVLNAHYTSPVLIKAIYKAVENMGFSTGNILDPGCGVGNFLGLLPQSMADSKVFGIEIDPITGRIARQLYQKNSIAIQGYESTDLPDSFFDLAIGNVPFGNYGVADKRYDKHKFLIHDYFFGATRS